jgi:acyl dehydratase
MFAHVSRSFSAADVLKFAELTGDDNPIHLDPTFASTTRFKRCIVHGLLGASLFPMICGSQIDGSLYLSQSLKFRKPIFIDELVTAKVQVLTVRKSPLHIATCETFLVRKRVEKSSDADEKKKKSNQLFSSILDLDDEVLIEGEASVMLP